MSVNNIVINFDKTAPNVLVIPEPNTAIQIPFSIYLYSDEESTVYYRLDEETPVPGEPGVYETTTPFEVVISEGGIHNITFFAIDDVGNETGVYRYTYYGSGDYTLFRVHPNVVSAAGGTVIEVSGDGFNPGAVIILNGEALTTSFVNNALLRARTLALDPGSYDLQVDDPQNGLSIILVNAVTIIEKTEDKIPDPPLEPGETRKHVFETTEGPMVLTRTLVENYDADTLVELQAKDLGVTMQIEQNSEDYPQNIEVQ